MGSSVSKNKIPMIFNFFFLYFLQMKYKGTIAIKIAVHVIIGTVVYTSEIKLPEDKLSIIPVPLPD